MPRRQPSCAMNLNVDRLNSINTGKRLPMSEISGKARAAWISVKAMQALLPWPPLRFLERKVNEASAELDALEDLGRHNGIPLGKLRGE